MELHFVTVYPEGAEEESCAEELGMWLAEHLDESVEEENYTTSKAFLRACRRTAQEGGRLVLGIPGSIFTQAKPVLAALFSLALEPSQILREQLDKGVFQFEPEEYCVPQGSEIVQTADGFHGAYQFQVDSCCICVLPLERGITSYLLEHGLESFFSSSEYQPSLFSGTLAQKLLRITCILIIAGILSGCAVRFALQSGYTPQINSHASSQSTA